MKWFERLFEVAAKEVLQLARDRVTVSLIVGISAAGEASLAVAVTTPRRASSRAASATASYAIAMAASTCAPGPSAASRSIKPSSPLVTA